MSLPKQGLSRQETILAPGTPSQDRASRPRSARPLQVKPQPVQPQPQKPQSVEAISEQSLKETLLYYNRARLAAMNAVQRDRSIIKECQETIDAIRSKASATHGQMSAEDRKILESEENRKKLWKTLNAEKIHGCRRLIGLMDKAEEDLMKLRPKIEEDKRKGVKANEAFCKIPRNHRLAVGAPPSVLLGKTTKSAPLSVIINED